MIADVRKNSRQRNSISQNRQTALEVAARDAFHQLARIYMNRAGCCACGCLFLNALRLPSLDLFPIHQQSPGDQPVAQLV
jgi:hypothetical protein